MDFLSSGLLGLSGMAIQSMPSGKSQFEDTSDSPSLGVVIAAIIIIVILIILFTIATYKLTGSKLQAVLCFIFGFFYIGIAYLYYGFSGYKFQKK